MNALASLAAVEGTVTIANGIALLPDKTEIDLRAALLLECLPPQRIAQVYAAYLSQKLHGTVWSHFDEEEQEITVRGSLLPACAEFIARYGVRTWELLDSHSVAQCRTTLAEAYNDPSYRATIVHAMAA